MDTLCQTSTWLAHLELLGPLSILSVLLLGTLQLHLDLGPNVEPWMLPGFFSGLSGSINNTCRPAILVSPLHWSGNVSVREVAFTPLKEESWRSQQHFMAHRVPYLYPTDMKNLNYKTKHFHTLTYSIPRKVITPTLIFKFFYLCFLIAEIACHLGPIQTFPPL